VVWFKLKEFSVLQTRFAVTVDRLSKAFDIVCKAMLVE